MNKELLRSREGENQRPDQASTRRDASTSNGYIRDFAIHPYQLHDQQQREAKQGKEKSIMTPEMEMMYNRYEQEKYHNNLTGAIQEIIEQRHGKTSSHSEIPLGYQEGLRGGGQLTAGNWNTLKNGLNSIKDAFNSNESKKIV